MLKKLLFVCFLLPIGKIQAVDKFDFNPNIREAYQLAMSLRLNEAQAQIDLEKQQNPSNLASLLVEDYIDFFTVFINENKAEFDRLEPNKNTRLKRIRQSDSQSPYYRYAQAEITLHWALARLKFEENITAAREVRKAYKLLEANALYHPDFIPNKKTLGLLHAMIGTIPDSYRWAIRLMGMDGTLAQGTSELRTVIQHAKTHPDFLFGDETAVMYALLMLHIGNNEAEAWQLVNEVDMDTQNNPLAAFILANIAMHTGRNDEAIHILETAPRTAPFYTFHYLDYMLGLAKLYRLDADADQYLQQYVSNFKGQNYIKEAYQKLAWHGLLFGKKDDYYLNMRLTISEGKAVIEGDKKAQKEAQNGTIPDLNLLKARLLFDGGYYEKALNTLQATKTNEWANKRLEIEHLYRLGRVYHELGKVDKAIEFYGKTIIQGSELPWYFACNAALKTGNLYETEGQPTQARAFYKKCLTIYPEEYRNGLHQQAKAGLNRLKKK